MTGPARDGGGPVGGGPDSERQVLLILNAALRHGRVAVLAPLVAVVLALLIASVLRRNFVATSQFMPQTQETRSSAAGLAAQFGISLAVNGPNPESPDFYAQLMQSRELLEDVARTHYQVPVAAGSADSLRGTLLDLIPVQGEDSTVRVRRGLKWLRKHISVGVTLKTGVVDLRVTGPWPTLVERVNRRLLELVNRYNLTRRQTRASAERAFVEERLNDARDSLAVVESRYLQFLERNRQYQQSPELAFQAARFERQVGLRQQLYATLSQAYEQARIEEVRNTPVITVVDPPEGSGVRASGNYALAVFLGFLIGLAVSLAWVFGQEYIAAQRSRHPADYEEFVLLRSALLTRILPGKRGRPGRDG